MIDFRSFEDAVLKISISSFIVYCFDAILIASFLAKGKTRRMVGNAIAKANTHAWSHIPTNPSTSPKFIYVMIPDIMKLINPESKND